jgi:hypothetical protein
MTRRHAPLVALSAIALGACADSVLVAPSAASAARSVPAAAAGSDERATVSPLLADLNARLAASGAKVRIAKAELRMDATRWDGASSTILLANNRERGIGAEWVPGDPRRDGRIGVTYAVGSDRAVQPRVRNPDGSGVRLATYAELDAQIEEGVAAWRNLTCSTAPITRVAVAAGTDPDQLDELFGGIAPSANYSQPADIVQAGWQPNTFFRAFAGADGDNVIGVAFTFSFVDEQGEPTDIDGNGERDIGLTEVYYNARFFWGTSGAPNVVDFYSIITHETGHALGLNHFGKLFVTKKAAADGIQIADIKYAPYAMMNAAYVTGRNELAGTDNSSFCQIWASAK